MVSTTGMISREVFEIREGMQVGHSRDFLTVCGMGHSSQIALGIAIQMQNRKIYCLDGDGSVIMHMGSLPINGMQKCSNYCHIVLNNGAHDSVGGQPTVCFEIDLRKISKASGYETVLGATTKEEVLQSMEIIKRSKFPSFLEIKVKKGHRNTLGRPSTTPLANKIAFMGCLK